MSGPVKPVFVSVSPAPTGLSGQETLATTSQPSGGSLIDQLITR